MKSFQQTIENVKKKILILQRWSILLIAFSIVIVLLLIDFYLHLLVSEQHTFIDSAMAIVFLLILGVIFRKMHQKFGTFLSYKQIKNNISTYGSNEAKRCPSCGTPYGRIDYSKNLKQIYCSACRNQLLFPKSLRTSTSFVEKNSGHL